MKKLLLSIALTFCAISAANAQVHIETNATDEQMKQHAFIKFGVETDEKLKNIEITDIRKIKDPKQTNATLVGIDGKLYLSDSFQQAIAYTKVTAASWLEYPPAIEKLVKQRLEGKGGELFDMIVTVDVKKE